MEESKVRLPKPRVNVTISEQANKCIGAIICAFDAENKTEAVEMALMALGKEAYQILARDPEVRKHWNV